MSGHRFLADEHLPGSFLGVLESIGFDVLRCKDEFEEGTEDGTLLKFAAETNRTVITCDNRFPIVDGEHDSNHSGVIFAEQTTLTRHPEDAARAVDRIVTILPEDTLNGSEVYLSDWL